MRCKDCGYENDDDAKFCEKCGTELSVTPPRPSKKGLSTTNKILIVTMIVLIAGLGIACGMLLTNKPVVNNTTNTITSPGSNNTSNTPNNAADSGPKLIDSGSTSGESSVMDNSGGPFTFDWKTYQIDDNNIIIYTTYTTQSKTVKQTGTIKQSDLGRVQVSVEPKATGKGNYVTVTTMYGYNTVLDYYWGHFRQNWLMKGPIH